MMKPRKLIIAAALMLPAIALIGMAALGGWFGTGNKKMADLPDAATEYNRLLENYHKKSNGFYLSGAITLYDGENPDVIKEQNQFSVLADGTQSSSRLGHLKTYYDGEWMLQIDSLERVVIVGKAGKNNTTATDLFQQSPAALFSDTAAFRISGNVSGNDTERSLTLKSDFNPEIRKYIILYDPVSYEIRQAEIHWWKDKIVMDTIQNERVWITTIKYYPLPVTDPQADKEIRKILKIQKDKVTLQPAYADYRLHVTF